MEEMQNVSNILSGKTYRKRLLVRHKHKREDNIEEDLA
jgi:hypothetical protein